MIVADSNASVIGLIILFAIWLVISLCFAIPTGISASGRRMNPFGWGALTFFTWVVGLVIFLIYLKPKCDDVKCSACGEMIPRVHVYCPFCGHKD
ncbi:MAG: hypothetical protein ACI4IJ_03085 [Acutalibacteraceae bacterium]